ncbi:MAG: hypothetical protein RLZZ139_2262 [Cyanobacteriota bacterium]|jgi:hypothetical protein
MTTESQPTIKLELTDKQLEVLGTAIGKEIVRGFSAKQEYWYGTTGWLAKVVEKFADFIVNNVSGKLEYRPQDYTKLITLIHDIWGAKK